LLQFVNIWRARHRRQQRYLPSGLLELRTLSSPLNDPSAVVSVAIDEERRANAVLAPIRNSVNRTILRLVADDYSLDEISELVGLDYKQVEARLYRARQKLRSLHQGGPVDA
jgi:DNA-directed RNA polymerase specialized sigma24 family protein